MWTKRRARIRRTENRFSRRRCRGVFVRDFLTSAAGTTELISGMNGVGRGVKYYRGLALAIAAAMWAASGSAQAGTPDIPKTLPDSYMSLAFVNESGVQNLEWLRAALPAAL